MKLSSSTGKDGPVFLPMSFAGRNKLKQSLSKTVLSQRIAGTTGPPPVAAHTVRNVAVCISVQDATFQNELIQTARTAWAQIQTNKTATTCRAQRQFVYTIMHTISSKLFTAVPAVTGNVYKIASLCDDGERKADDVKVAGSTTPDLKRHK